MIEKTQIRPSIGERIKKAVTDEAKAFVFKYTKLGAPPYLYNIEPIQLTFLINEIERLKAIQGNIIEVGVARGMTTKFLCEHIKLQKLESNLKFYAIDTFSSFQDEDLAFEVEKRGKSLFELKGFNYNDYDVWSKNFADYKFLTAIKSDCTLVNYKEIGPIKLAFLDVDLYLPTTKTLPMIYESLVPGGSIVIDDVMNNNRWDGAYQAYMEYCQSNGVAPHFVGNKCGVITKPGAG